MLLRCSWTRFHRAEQTEQTLARHPAVTALEHGGILYYQQILYSLFLYCPLIFLPYLINIYNLVKKRSFFCNKNIHPCCTGEFIRWWPVKLAAHSLLFALFTPEILFMVSSLLWLLQWKHDLIPAPRTHSGIYLHRYLSIDIYSISTETHIIYGLQMWAVDLDIFHPSPGILAFQPQVTSIDFPWSKY